MSDLTNYAETNLVDHLMGTTAYTMPTAVWLGLFTAAPSDTGGGTEASGGAYARQEIEFNAASSPGGQATNANTETFTASGAGWGTITHVALFDAVTSGNMLAWTAVTNVTINDGDSLEYDPADITFTLA